MKINLNRARSLTARGRFFLIAILLFVGVFLGGLPASKSAHAAIGTVTEYTSGFPSNPYAASIKSITVGPDGKIWYTANNTNSHVGKMTTSGAITNYAISINSGAYPSGITVGSDGNIWYATSKYNSSVSGYDIVKMTTNGVVLNRYTVASINLNTKMELGPDGNIWFLKNDGNVGMITPSGVVTSYNLTNTGGTGLYSADITFGPDGNLWYTLSTSSLNKSGVGKLNISTGATSFYVVAGSQLSIFGIATGSDGNVWFTAGSKIGKITTSGVLSQFTVPTAATGGITLGSDGALWYSAGNNIGRITVGGDIVQYSAPGSKQDIITGPDGAVWYIKQNSSIGRMATELSGQTISFTTGAPTDSIIDGQTYTPLAVSTSGLPVDITVDSSSNGVCSIDAAGVVSFPGFGTCTLNANQAGNIDYSPAVQIQQSFDVAPVDADSSVVLDCPATVMVGATITCSITLANNGPASAGDASLTALFSGELTGGSLVGGGSLTGRHITWTTPFLSSGSPETLTFSATATTPGKARLSAALLQVNPDPSSTNNITNAVIVISQP